MGEVSLERNVASLNILVHDVINLLYRVKTCFQRGFEFFKTISPNILWNSHRMKACLKRSQKVKVLKNI